MIPELLLFIIFIISLLSVVMCAQKRHMLVGSLVGLMILIPVFGYKIIETSILEINATAPVYSAVLIGVVLGCELFGKRFARSTVNSVFVADFIFVLSAFLLANLACIHLEIDQAARTLFTPAPRIAAFSFIAFFVSSRLAIYMFSVMRDMGAGFIYSLAISTCIAQFFDSAIFFPGSFLGVEPIDVVVNLTIFGFLHKAVITFISLPIVYFFVELSVREAAKRDGCCDTIQ